MCAVFCVQMFLVMKSSYDLCFNVDLSVEFPMWGVS